MVQGTKSVTCKEISHAKTLQQKMCNCSRMWQASARKMTALLIEGLKNEHFQGIDKNTQAICAYTRFDFWQMSPGRRRLVKLHTVFRAYTQFFKYFFEVITQLFLMISNNFKFIRFYKNTSRS